MSFWIIINALIRLTITYMVIEKMLVHRIMLTWIERLGLGLIGGAGFMTIPVILTSSHSPFDEWASALFSLGLAIFLWGRRIRNNRHSSNNQAQIRIAEAHFSAKGK